MRLHRKTTFGSRRSSVGFQCVRPVRSTLVGFGSGLGKGFVMAQCAQDGAG